MIIETYTERWLMGEDLRVHRIEQTRPHDEYNVWTWDCACPIGARGRTQWVKVPPPPGVWRP
jgi:hypothetical protein